MNYYFPLLLSSSSSSTSLSSSIYLLIWSFVIIAVIIYFYYSIYRISLSQRLPALCLRVNGNTTISFAQRTPTSRGTTDRYAFNRRVLWAPEPVWTLSKWKRKIFCPDRTSNRDPSVVYPVDWSPYRISYHGHVNCPTVQYMSRFKWVILRTFPHIQNSALIWHNGQYVTPQESRSRDLQSIQNSIE